MHRTLGNATELIIAILALVKCQLDVVQSSLLGSILSYVSVLSSDRSSLTLMDPQQLAPRPRRSFPLIQAYLRLVLTLEQMCFFAGGIRFSEQGFSTVAAQLNSSLLMMSVVAVLIPAGFVRPILWIATTSARAEYDMRSMPRSATWLIMSRVRTF